jgi:hypothetical protein
LNRQDEVDLPLQEIKAKKEFTSRQYQTTNEAP